MQLAIHPEVSDALADGRPVVALESTIITHGMPYPANLETARGVEEVVRENGATPATIAVLDGRLCIGLDDAALERLSKAEDVAKASRRDLPALVARVPRLEEVSIGHGLTADALEYGMAETVRRFRRACGQDA